MKFSTLATSVLLAFSACQISVLAEEVSSPAPSSTISAQAEQAPKPAEACVSGKVVPKISVRWDCGDCEQNPKVAPLIEKTYETEAATKGYSISTNENAEIVIKEYRQRNPAARVLFGVFAGKDKLATKLSFRGKEYVANDYAANAFYGMNSLCESIAQQAFTQVLSALKQ